MEKLFKIFLLFSLLLPFQFALSPTKGVDLAIVRILIPAIFLAIIFLQYKKFKIIREINNSNFLLLALLILFVISLFQSSELAWSLRKLAFIFSIAPIYYVAYVLANTTQRQKQVISCLIVGALMLSAVGILQFLGQFIFGIDPVLSFWNNWINPFFLGETFAQTVSKYPSWMINSSSVTYLRAFAVFPDPHMFAYYLELLLPWSLVLIISEKKHQKFYAFTAIAILFGIIFSFTRGSYLAIIFASIVIVPFVEKKYKFKIFLAAAVFALIFLIAPSNPVGQRLESSFNIKEGSNQGRIYNWKQSLPVITKNPLGVGIGMYPLAVKPNADYREPIYAHNAFLDIAAEEGLAASALFIFILVLSFFSFIQKSRKKLFYLAGAASILIFFIHSMVESPIYSVHILPLLLIILAIGFNEISLSEKN